MKKTTCTTFVDILNTIHEKGITTKAALMADQHLYTYFWLAAQDFVRFYLFSTNRKTTTEGKQLSGNNARVDILEVRGITTRDDITMDCVVKMVEYAENILQKPTVTYMENYACSIVNSVVNSIYRTLPPDEFKIVSLNSTIESFSVAAEGAYTYEDIIADDTYNPERLYIEYETVKELKAK